MKTLILMRHAKSSWAEPGLDDHDRPLNTRGRQSAKALGEWMRAQNLTPEEAFVSTAQRTRETFEGLGLDMEARFEKTLYHASSDQMLQVLKNAASDTVLLIGHNPGIAYFAEELVATTPEHPRFYDYPTCATLVVDFEIDAWDRLVVSTGNARDFVVPRELLE